MSDGVLMEHAQALREGLRWALSVSRGVEEARGSSEFREAEDSLLAFGAWADAGNGPVDTSKAMKNRGQGIAAEGGDQPNDPAAATMAAIDAMLAAAFDGVEGTTIPDDMAAATWAAILTTVGPVVLAVADRLGTSPLDLFVRGMELAADVVESESAGEPP